MKRTALRFFFIYFVIQVVPLDWKFYQQLFSINWSQLHFFDLFNLTRYTPQFFGLTGYANWGVAALLAATGTAIWQYTKKWEVDDDTLHYWLRVLLRYRLAIGIIAYGLIKLFPLQMPFPSLSNLHTNYGDFLPWKIYFHTQGFAQTYESFLGAVEVLAGFLLFFRKTTTLGSGLMLGFIGNVFAANLAYDIGEQVYSAFLLSIAAFLFVYDVPRLFSLLALERYTVANKFQPVFDHIKRIRFLAKTAFILFVVLLGYTTYANYAYEPYKVPKAPGLANAYGYYNVREFKLNGREIPYTLTDSNRWQNVVFEKWATISIKSAKPVLIDYSTGSGYAENDIDRNYESAGIGGRHYFGYYIDSVHQQLILQNKNRNRREEKYQLHFTRPDANTIVVEGVNEKNDSIYAVLERINRKYMLLEGRRKPVKL